MSVSELPSIFLVRDKWRTGIIIIHCPAPLWIPQNSSLRAWYFLFDKIISNYSLLAYTWDWAPRLQWPCSWAQLEAPHGRACSRGGLAWLLDFWSVSTNLVITLYCNVQTMWGFLRWKLYSISFPSITCGPTEPSEIKRYGWFLVVVYTISPVVCWFSFHVNNLLFSVSHLLSSSSSSFLFFELHSIT